jgi:predicted 3-demethylubiquinone-9 3-methyltransferase (glyoxalase superfamily)
MKLMGDKNKVKAGRVMQAMMQMHKIDIAKLKKAYAAK